MCRSCQQHSTVIPVGIAGSLLFTRLVTSLGMQRERISQGVLVANPSIPMKSLDLKSILAAIDFTSASDKALEHGIAIARHYRATLYVVYVVSSVGFTLSGPDAVRLAASASERDIHLYLDEVVNSGRLNGVEVRPVVLTGNIDEQMESFVRAHRVDLMVVSTQARCGIARLFFGSMAQTISKSCCCPVLTVGPHSAGPWLDNLSDSRKPLLFATAFNKASAIAATYAIALAKDFQRELFVLHIRPTYRARIRESNHLTNEEYKALAFAQLNTLIPSGANQEYKTTFLVESSDPAQGILRVAKRVDATTIIMGAHRDLIPDLSTRLAGAITSHVNREANCPVLTVRG